jgi:hypothetical protein
MLMLLHTGDVMRHVMHLIHCHLGGELLLLVRRLLVLLVLRREGLARSKWLTGCKLLPVVLSMLRIAIPILLTLELERACVRRRTIGGLMGRLLGVAVWVWCEIGSRVETLSALRYLLLRLVVLLLRRRRLDVCVWKRNLRRNELLLHLRFAPALVRVKLWGHDRIKLGASREIIILLLVIPAFLILIRRRRLWWGFHKVAEYPGTSSLV